MNGLLIFLFIAAVIALVIFLIVRNQKDEQKFEKELNNESQDIKDKKNATIKFSNIPCRCVAIFFLRK